MRQELLEVISALPSNSASVVQVSEQSFAVFGLPTASNPLGFCHVKKEKKAKSGYCCTGKDCRSFASKAKGSKVKACCLHLHLLFASLQQFSSPVSTSPESSAVPQTSGDSSSLQRKSTVLLAEKCRKLPYHISKDLLRGIISRDACSLFGVQGSWPDLFYPAEEHCGLCGSPLGHLTNHPGQKSHDTYLITELNAFKKVDVKVKTCLNKNCLAIHQPFPIDIGKIKL